MIAESANSSSQNNDRIFVLTSAERRNHWENRALLNRREWCVSSDEEHIMIDGLKLTFSGAELRTLLDIRIRDHEDRAASGTHEQSRTKEDETEEAPLLPTEMCGNEAQRHAWRASVLTFIRDHLDLSETYRLDSAALEFGELLPPMLPWLAQEEYEERTAVGFHVGRIAKTADRLATSVGELLWHRHSGNQPNAEPAASELIEETDEFRTTRLNIEGSPEVVVIERK